MNDSTKKALLISGISIVAVSVGFFFGYRLYKRWNKDVIEGKHNTILIDKDESKDDVEVVGFDEKGTEGKEWSETKILQKNMLTYHFICKGPLKEKFLNKEKNKIIP